MSYNVLTMYQDECKSGPKSNDGGLVKGDYGLWCLTPISTTFQLYISWRSVLSGYLHFQNCILIKQKSGRTKVINRNK